MPLASRHDFIRAVGHSCQSADDEISCERFAAAPATWYYMCAVSDLARGPRSLALPEGQSFVAFLPEPDKPVVLGARCSHMGADLARGCVKNGRLACPLHGWEYAGDGHCAHIPASSEIPAFARQIAYPTEVIGGRLFFFNRPAARFPLPFFAGCDPAQMRPARPCELHVDTPWEMIGANGFDLQHFRCAHDRTLVGEPLVDSPHEFARRLRADFLVTGDSFLDRFTRFFAGRALTMTVESWAGGHILATATFRKITTYGMLSLLPLAKDRTCGRLIMWVPRARGFGRLLAPLNAELRRFFIRAFLESDIGPLAGVRATNARLIGADKVLADYLGWLQKVHR